MRADRPADGVLVVDKQAGRTSHDVVAEVRRRLGIRRVGHAGTLDPMATGVLVLGYGRGTRLLPYLQATRKSYRATVRLGLATTTDDRTGEPLSGAPAISIYEAAIDAALAHYRGDIQQRPSTISAIKVGGRRAYSRARAGEQVHLPQRPVSLHQLDRRGALRPAAEGCVDFDIEVTCSSGTYIRALARDIGADLGCGGHLTALRRTAVGPFALDAADQEVPLSLGAAAAAVLPSLRLDGEQVRQVANGVRIPCASPQDGPTALLSPTGELVAVATATGECWAYAAVFTR